MNELNSIDQAVEDLGDFDPYEDDELEEDEDEQDEEVDEADDEESEEEESEEDDLVPVWDAEAEDWVQVSREEAKSGYLKAKDYTQKTMALADQRREAEALQERLAGREKELEAALTEWAIQEEQEPDWVTIAQQYPQQYNLYRAQWDQKQRSRAAARTKLEQMHSEAHMQRLEAAKSAILAEFPEWSDATKAQEAIAGIVQTARELGYSDQDIAQIDDPRQVKALLMVGQASAAKSKQPTLEKRIGKADKTLRPGPSVSAKAKASKKAAQAHKRFKSAPTMENALAALSGTDWS